MSENIISSVVVDAKSTVGDRLMFIDHKPLIKYVEGIRGEQEGITCVCLSEKMKFNKVSIKLIGVLQLPFEFDGTPIMVEFEELEGKLWQDWSNKGEVKLSLSAKGIKQATDKRIRLNGDK